MYNHILVPVEHSDADQTVLAHVSGLAHMTSARLLLVHVADGWAARNFDQLKLRESEEMKSDRAYLDGLRESLASQGFSVQTKLAMGDPATELIRSAEEHHADLIAMSTHGHRFLADVLHGTTADRVRHLEPERHRLPLPGRDVELQVELHRLQRTGRARLEVFLG